jgi:hypothetical protein
MYSLNYPVSIMRKAVLILLFGCFLTSTNSWSQVLLGPVAGSQVTWISFSDDASKEQYQAEPVIGFHAGASLSFRVQKRYFLHTSLLYIQRGKEIKSTIDPLLNNTVRYNYLELPILYTAEFKGKIGQNKEYKWYLGAGPNIGYWMGGKGSLASSDLNENLINPPDYMLDYSITFKKPAELVQQGDMNVADPNRFQFGLNVSAGIVLEPAPRQRVMLTTRYMIGHSFFSRTSKGDFGLPGIEFYKDDLQVRNQEFVLSLHYFFDLNTAERDKGKSTLKLNENKKPTSKPAAKKSFKKTNTNRRPPRKN